MSSSQRVRTREPERRQGEIVFEMPEDRLAEDHPARVLWKIVETLNLAAFLNNESLNSQELGRPSGRLGYAGHVTHSLARERKVPAHHTGT